MPDQPIPPTPAPAPSPAPSASIERERLTSLINSMADAVVAIDNKLQVVVYNAAALNILDINTFTEGMPLSKVMLLIDKDKKPVKVIDLVQLATRPTTWRDYSLQYADSSSINLNLSIAPVHLGYGKQADQGFVLVLRDITHEKSLEEERDEFISVISHELRTPIAIAEGNLSNAQFIVQKQHDPPAVEEAIKQAYDQVTFLSGMINDLSMLSRAERGTSALEVEPINVHDLVTELAHDYTPQAEKKGLQLNLYAAPNLELLQSSRLYVHEILQNFVTNSIKYTEKGSVTLSAVPKDKGVLFEVHDTGIGISKGDQEKVYEKFFRSEDYRTRKNNGTGLGLYVTAKLARLIGAQLSLQSELSAGSIFSIYVPNHPPTVVKPAQPATPAA